MEIFVRPWVRNEDYGSVKADILLWGRLLASDPKIATAELAPARS